MDDFIKVAKTSDLAEDETMMVEVGEKRIVLSNIGGKFYAIGEVCPHAEGPLSEGLVEDGEVECPWHGSRFDLRTGEATSPPADEAVPKYGVRVEGDEVLVGPASEPDP
jgi:nitrite reductase/ring-hydroxylating ferredoxin subunit